MVRTLEELETEETRLRNLIKKKEKEVWSIEAKIKTLQPLKDKRRYMNAPKQEITVTKMEVTRLGMGYSKLINFNWNGLEFTTEATFEPNIFLNMDDSPRKCTVRESFIINTLANKLNRENNPNVGTTDFDWDQFKEYKKQAATTVEANRR